MRLSRPNIDWHVKLMAIEYLQEFLYAGLIFDDGPDEKLQPYNVDFEFNWSLGRIS